MKCVFFCWERVLVINEDLVESTRLSPRDEMLMSVESGRGDFMMYSCIRSFSSLDVHVDGFISLNPIGLCVFFFYYRNE